MYSIETKMAKCVLFRKFFYFLSVLLFETVSYITCLEDSRAVTKTKTFFFLHTKTKVTKSVTHIELEHMGYIKNCLSKTVRKNIIGVDIFFYRNWYSRTPSLAMVG